MMRFTPGCRCCTPPTPPIPDVCEPSCSFCTGLCCIKFTIAGVAVLACEDCPDINGDYYLCDISQDTGPSGELCIATKTIDLGTLLCGFPTFLTLEWTISGNDIDGYTVNVLFYVWDGVSILTGKYFQGSGIVEYETADELCLPTSDWDTTDFDSFSLCDVSAATITITPIIGEDCCTHCTSGPPKCVRLVIDQFENDTCSTCTDFNGEFVLVRTDLCVWETAPFEGCEDPPESYYYELTVSGTSIAVNLRRVSDGAYIVIWVEGTPDLDCDTWEDYGIPLDGASFGNAPSGCTNNDTGEALLTTII